MSKGFVNIDSVLADLPRRIADRKSVVDRLKILERLPGKEMEMSEVPTDFGRSKLIKFKVPKAPAMKEMSRVIAEIEQEIHRDLRAISLYLKETA